MSGGPGSRLIHRAAHPFAAPLLTQRTIPRSSLPHIDIHYLEHKRGQLFSLTRGRSSGRHNMPIDFS
jgi:hypothetical protein